MAKEQEVGAHQYRDFKALLVCACFFYECADFVPHQIGLSNAQNLLNTVSIAIEDEIRIMLAQSCRVSVANTTEVDTRLTATESQSDDANVAIPLKTADSKRIPVDQVCDMLTIVFVVHKRRVLGCVLACMPLC